MGGFGAPEANLTPLLPLVLWIACGFQTLAPWRLARGPGLAPARLAGLGLLLWSTLALLLPLSLSIDPDPAVAQGLAPPWTGNRSLLAGVFLWGTVLAGNLILLHAGHGLGAVGLRLLAAIGGLALLLGLHGLEALRVGAGPPTATVERVGIVLLGVPVCLAAAELFLPGRPVWSPAAALALPAAALLFPPELGPSLGLDRVTLLAAACLLALARFVPQRFRRPSLALGLGLGSLWVDRAGAASQRLGERLFEWVELSVGSFGP